MRHPTAAQAMTNRSTLRMRLALILSALLVAILACNIPAQNPSQKPSGSGERPTNTPRPTRTVTPVPSLIIPPSDTATVEPPAGSTPMVTLTPLPLDLQLSVFEDVWSVINDGYVSSDFNGVDWNAVHTNYRERIRAGLGNTEFYQTMKDMIAELGDDHSHFLSPEEVALEEEDYQGQHDYVGIGALVGAVPERDRAVILSVFPGSPAELAGLQPRDNILSVDGTPMLDGDGYLRDIIRGPEDTTILMVVETPGQSPRDVSITRHRISGAVPVPYSVLTTSSGKRIGYLLFVTFDDSTIPGQVGAALENMTRTAPLDGIIIDNRMNGGGSSDVVEPILGYFTGGTLGHFVSRSEERPLQIRQNNIHGSSEIPMVVLVGSGTASFGEIFAGVLQDSGRAHIIGITTDGNVEILWGYNLPDGSRVWVASETFRPSVHPDADWETTGILPDETVAGEFDEYSLETDPPVIASLNYFDSLP